MNKKLLVLTAAGASSPYKIYSVKDVGCFLERLCESDCEEGEFPPYYMGIRSLKLAGMNAFKYLLQEAKKNDPYANFETALMLLAKLAAEKVQRVNQGLSENLSVITHSPHYSTYGGKYDLERLYQRFVDEILKKFQKKCKVFDTSELLEFKKFLQTIGVKYDLAGYTLNYDNLLLQAMSCSFGAGFTGNGSEFDSNLLKNQRESGEAYCIHLHGSIHFNIGFNSNSNERCLAWHTPPLTSSSFGQGPAVQSGLATIARSPIIAGGYKEEQISASFYHEYFKALEDDTMKSDALLIIGYGFLDEHVNRVISSMREKPISIVDWSNSDTKPFLEEKISKVFNQSSSQWTSVPGSRVNQNIRLWLKGLPGTFESVNDIMQHFDQGRSR